MEDSTTTISFLNLLVKEISTTTESLSQLVQMIENFSDESKEKLKNSMGFRLGTNEKDGNNIDKRGIICTKLSDIQDRFSETISSKSVNLPPKPPKLWRDGVDPSKLIRKEVSYSKKTANGVSSKFPRGKYVPNDGDVSSSDD